MKKIILGILTLFVSSIVILAQGTIRYGSAQGERNTITVPYNVSDSRAYSFAKIWISEQLNGERSIRVDDVSNGIISGEAQFTVMATTYLLRYRIFIENGNIDLNIQHIELLIDYTYMTKPNSQEEADRAARERLQIWENRLINTFKEMFE